ncbi:MAG TPA: GNAT family N-acetyltransferase [Paludibacter sp.]|nr:GNAT family N-acetyltransferase [Paludibacter sp.]
MTVKIKDTILVRELNYDSDDYRKELELRDEVLRKPLGMSLYNDNLEGDKNDTHIGAFLGEELVGVLILTRLSQTDVKMRQVAVAEAMQSQKVGSKMVRFAEAFARKAGYKNMVLNARKTAVSFYLKQGYSIIGDEFQEINIPHYKMQKQIG